MTKDTPDTSPEAPYCRAAFINAIREEGTHAEACDWLQKIWNERCALSAERDALKGRAEAAETAIDAALERLDASLFTNAEHQQAKDILRAVKEGKE